MTADPLSVRLTRDAVLEWFREQRLPDDHLATAISLATSEAVANVVRHAYDDSSGRVDLDAEVRDDRDIVIVVADRGRGLTAKSKSPRTGLGLPVIGRVANGVTVSSDSDGTTVTMRFDLPRGDRRGSWRPLHAKGAGLRAIGPLHGAA